MFICVVKGGITGTIYKIGTKFLQKMKWQMRYGTFIDTIYVNTGTFRSKLNIFYFVKNFVFNFINELFIYFYKKNITSIITCIRSLLGHCGPRSIISVPVPKFKSDPYSRLYLRGKLFFLFSISDSLQGFENFYFKPKYYIK